MNDKAYLVIIESPRLKYENQYRLFRSKENAFKWASKNGWEGGILFNDKVGMLNSYQSGDVNVGILPVEVLP